MGSVSSLTLTDIINNRKNAGLAVTDSDFEVRDTAKSFHLSEFKFPSDKWGIAIPRVPPASIPRITLETDCDLLRAGVPET